jgi:hypothetical protein
VQEISDVARSLKAMAKELEVPVIALSQLNRGVEARGDKRPVLSDIRESGSIEAEADVVMLLSRDSYYKAKEENRQIDYDPDNVIFAKHRNGPTGKVSRDFSRRMRGIAIWFAGIILTKLRSMECLRSHGNVLVLWLLDLSYLRSLNIWSWAEALCNAPALWIRERPTHKPENLPGRL